MFFNKIAALFSVVAVLFAGQALAIATDAVSACNPPNNGDHHEGSSCKFFSGPSTNSPVVSGLCITEANVLTCVG